MLCKCSVHTLSLWDTEFQGGSSRVYMCPINYRYFQRSYVGATHYKFFKKIKYHRAFFDYLILLFYKEYFLNITNGETNILAYRYIQCTNLYFKNAGREIIYIFIHIYIILDLMNNSILLLSWSCCIACMPRARPWLVTRWKRDCQGQNGTHGAPSLFPESHLLSNTLSFVTY